MGGKTSPRASLVGPVAETIVVDPLTVRFKLKNPWPIFPAYLPFNQVVSKAFVEKVGTDGMATQAMGAGPFKLVEWRRGDSVILYPTWRRLPRVPHTLADALRWGNAVGALKVARDGGARDQPSRAEVEALLAAG